MRQLPEDKPISRSISRRHLATNRGCTVEMSLPSTALPFGCPLRRRSWMVHCLPLSSTGADTTDAILLGWTDFSHRVSSDVCRVKSRQLLWKGADAGAPLEMYFCEPHVLIISPRNICPRLPVDFCIDASNACTSTETGLAVLRNSPPISWEP